MSPAQPALRPTGKPEVPGGDPSSRAHSKSFRMTGLKVVVLTSV